MWLFFKLHLIFFFQIQQGKLNYKSVIFFFFTVEPIEMIEIEINLLCCTSAIAPGPMQEPAPHFGNYQSGAWLGDWGETESDKLQIW